MDSTITLWLIGAGIALMAMLLVVVRVARRLDRNVSRAPKAAVAQTLVGLLEQTGQAKWITGLQASASGSAAKPRAHKKELQTGMAVVAAAVTVVGALAAVIAKSFDSTVDVASLPSIEIAAGELHGTYLSAGNKKPVVLIVPGSGPTDRDGNSPAGLKTDAYKLLAEGLASQRISSVRVDKRGMFGSAGAGDPNTVSVDAYAADYRAWIDAIRKETGRKCVWLLGHSEGALMVSAAAQGRKDVCGLILVAGMGRKMGDVIRQQLKDNPANAPVLNEALAALSELEAGRHVDTTAMTPALLPLFAPPVQDYLISILPVDPVEVLDRAHRQTLIVQGTTDLQVTKEDADLLNKAWRTKLRMIDGMNHVLKEAPADRAANLATYSDPSLPLPKKLVDVIEDFIEGD